MEWERLSIFNGINRHLSPFLSPENETNLDDVENLATDKIGVLSKSFDYSIKGSQITASQDILGGIDFYRNDGTHDHLVAIDGTNSDIYYYTGGSWSSQSLSRTSGEKIRFAYSPTLDHLFACNISDATTGWNGSSWSTTTNLTDAPKAKYVMVFGRRVYLLNTDVGGTRYRDRAYRSSLVDSGSISWDTTNDWIVFDDVIKGVGRNGENMFVACENSCHIFTKTDERYQITNIGCVSHDSIASYGEWTYWAADDGIYAFDGGETKKISLPIQEYWDGIAQANKSGIQSDIKDHHLYIWVGDLTSPDTMNNVVFDYDILQNNFCRAKTLDNMTNFHTYVTSTGKELFMGSDNGEIFQLFDSKTQNTKSFPSSFTTRWVYGSGANAEDDYKQVWGYGNNLGGIQVLYKKNSSDNWKPLGQLNGETDVVKFNVRAYRIKFKFKEYSKNDLYEIHGIDIGYIRQYIKQEDIEE